MAGRAHSMLLKLPSLFDNAEISDHYSCGVPEAFVLSKQISNAWAKFARTGNPSHSGLPRWPAYRSERRATMYRDAPCHVRNDAEQEALRHSTIVNSSKREPRDT